MITIEKKDTSAGTFLDITVNGITIYGCQRKQGVGPKGAYDFISTPRKLGKAKDGSDKWYDIVKLSKEVNADIIRELEGNEISKHYPDPDSEVPF
jgi:hypothetical protein